VAQVIHEKFPLGEIVGVEIDPLVVELGKKYFGLGEIQNLKIVVGDAISPVQSSKFNTSTSSVLSRTKSRDKVQSFDLVIVDLYVGQEFPKEAESEDFLRAVGRLANKGALVLFNRLYYNHYHQKKADGFVAKLTTIFSAVKTKKLLTNLFISASF
jgi:spermidine synthase